MELWLICFLCLSLRLVTASADDPPVVTTSQGRITGTTLQFRPVVHPELARDVDAYLGIPYAEPPVGPLRFKAPVAKSWSGELKATKLGNQCPQPVMPLVKNLTLTGPFDEDCLFLDVFVPQSLPANAAVLVYIHGGGYHVGAGVMGEPFYPTATACVGDVIVVTINYRLGALGFLSSADDVIPGNFGLLDQRRAFEWVRDNIHAFGGDPKRVAIYGQSAGSGAVSLHMISPGSAGLFRGAIMESGDSTASWSQMSPKVGRKLAYAMGKEVGCNSETSGELLECLQKVEGTDVFVENQQLLQSIGEGEMVFFAPTVDGDFLPSKSEELLEKGAINNAVTIIGANGDEGMMMTMMLFPNNTADDDEPFLDSAAFDASVPMCSMMMSPEPIVTKLFKMAYTDAKCAVGPECNHLDALSQVCGDLMFVCPGEKSARAFTKAGRKVYRYHMTHVPTTTLLGPKWTKSNHGDEMSFIFGSPLMGFESYVFNEDEVRMSIKTITYWANLAKTGNPNLSSLDAELTDEEKKTEWPLFTVEGLEYKELTPEMLNGRGIKAQECRYVNEFIPELIKSLEEARKGEAAGDVANKWTQDGDPSSETCTDDKCPGE
ncbi:acetylcholinesterase-like [Asterias rubens]|uniref:acetylcholinesterase-like n=1 Tax=Asterias rubens TaxID=7604 RepID=UPI001455C741|nr:acetylcholinesterase-like [Asterias rubens]